MDYWFVSINFKKRETQRDFIGVLVFHQLFLYGIVRLEEERPMVSVGIAAYEMASRAAAD